MEQRESWAVILAGGSGTRFWPKSRQTSPKQLCKIGSTEKTLIEQTLDRLEGMVPPERRLIVTHEKQISETRRIVSGRAEHFIAEPEAKNTAAALTMAALEIKKISGSGDIIMMSFHADHIIENPVKFQKTLEEAARTADKGKLVLLGMVPEYPETGYGYIEKGKPFSDSGSYLVASFKEKPDLKTAKEFIDTGHFFWNSGIFIWKVQSFLSEVEAYIPQTLKRLTELQEQVGSSFGQMGADVLRPVYKTLQNIAVDHAILEVSENTAVTNGQFGWKDVGSWEGLSHCFVPDENDNLLMGDVLALNSRSCVIETDGPLIATLGIENLVVVAAKGAILVCPKNRSQDVKQIVTQLTKNNRTEFV